MIKNGKKNHSPLGGFTSGASLGGKVSEYADNQEIYAQGVPDFFGELCLANYPYRMSKAVALSASSIRIIKKGDMLELLRRTTRASNALVSYLLSRVKRNTDRVADLLTSP